MKTRPTKTPRLATRLGLSVMIVLAVAVTVCMEKARAQTAAPLRLVQTIPLPGVEGRIDHMAVDLRRGRLYVASLENGTVEVIDFRTGKRLRSLGGLHEPQGVGVDAASGRVFVAGGGSGTVEVYDGDTLRHVQSVTVGGDADDVRVDNATHTVFVGYGSGGIAILDARSGKHLDNISLAGHPEGFALERRGPRVFVNVPSAGRIAVADRRTSAVVAGWPNSEAQSNFSMALDDAHHRLFVGCRRPARLLVYDTASGKVVTSVAIAGDTDDVFYDDAAKRLYISCGAGSVDVLRQADADHYVRVGSVPTATGARTSLFVPEFGRLYLAVPHRGGQRAAIQVFSTKP